MELKEFYDDLENPAIPLIKHACSWVLVNGRDLSFIEGLPRYFSNVGLTFTTSFVMYHFLINSHSLLDFYIKFSLMSFCTSLLFMRMVAYWLLKWVDKYQETMRILDTTMQSRKL